MGVFRADKFSQIATEARAILHRNPARVAEHVLALAVQCNLKPFVAKEGQIAGHKAVYVKLAPIASFVRTDKGIQLQFNFEFHSIHTEQEFAMRLDEYNRIVANTASIIGLLPPFVRTYLCGSTDATEIARAQDWLCRLFGAMAKLDNAEWAGKARKEQERLRSHWAWEAERKERIAA